MTTIQGYRLSQQQIRLWQAGTGLTAFCRIAIQGDLEIGRLQAALDRCVARHEILRTRFRTRAGAIPLQVVEERAGWPLEATGSSFQVDAEEMNEPHAYLTLGEDGRKHLDLLLPALCVDPRSLDLLVEELCRLYAHPSRETAAFQFVDFSDWQNDLLTESPPEIAFWQNQSLSPPRLPMIGEPGPRPRVQSTEVAHERAGLTADQALACWLGLLSAMSGQTRVTVTTPIDGRIDAPFEKSLGCYAALVPVTVTVDGARSAGDLTKACRGALTEAAAHLEFLDHQSLTLPAGGCAFLHWDPPRTFAAGGLALRVVERRCAYQRFALCLEYVAGENGPPSLALQYDATCMAPAAAETIARHLGTFIAAYQDDATLARASLLDSSERARLLEDFNRTERLDPECATVHTLFERQVALDPDAIALHHGDNSLTYGQLNDRAEGVAARLRTRGIGPGRVVALCLDRKPALPVAIMAVLKTGAAYLPLDPEVPRARLAWMLTDSGAALVLTDGEAALEPSSVPHLAIRSVWDAGSAPPPPRVAVDPDQAAYLIYTSGSTGSPKAVVVPHRGVVNYLVWARSQCDLARGPGAPVFSTIAADLTVTSLLGPLIAGRALSLIEGQAAPEQFAALLASAASFNLIKMTPAHLKLLNQGLESLAGHASEGCLVLGGEALFAEDLAAWRSRFPNWRILNEYGPTEASVGCCAHEVTERSGAVPIGKPIANVRLFVLDERMQPLPQGFPGELYIGGPCLARGYHGRPALTAKAFVPDPIGGEQGQRLYRTGDRVRFTAGDQPILEFLGRNDAQVKVKGYRVELGEIEACLKTLPAIDDAVVLLWGERLVAYLTGAHPLFVDQLRETLAASLPEHMIPAFFIPLPQFPLTANGKIDREALPEPDRSRPQLSAAFVLPATPLERDLADVWRAALGIDSIGIHDNFFSLGGDSIRTVRAAAGATEKGLEVEIQDFFRFPTIAQLADHLGKRLAEWDEDQQLLTEIDGMSDEQAAALLAMLEAEEEK